MNATFSIWMFASIVAIDALFIGLLVVPARVLTTWFRLLRGVPPGALRAVAAIGVTLCTFVVVAFIRAWINVWSYGQ